MDLIAYLSSAGVLVFIITGFITLFVKMAKRPTWTETEERYTKKETCLEVQKRIDEKLSCVGEIKSDVTRIKTILEERFK